MQGDGTSDGTDKNKSLVLHSKKKKDASPASKALSEPQDVIAHSNTQVASFQSLVSGAHS